MAVVAKSANLDRVVAFSINPQSIESALIEFSKQAHIQVIISPRVNGASAAPALNTTVSARVGLETLLKNMGLTYAASGESVTVTRISARSSANAEVGTQQDESNRGSPSSTEGKATPGDRFRVVQVDQGKGSSEPSEQGQKSSSQFEEVVITGHYEFLSADTSGATNLPLPIEKVPQSISLVSNDFIQAANLKTLGEIAEYTPGAVNVGTPENYSSQITLRGFRPGQALDGVNIVGATYFEPDYAIYDRLEIVKGPSSVVYGVSSPGGLVNYVTKSATPETRDYAYVQAGSWKTYRIEGQIAGALDPEGHLRAIGIAVHDQGDSFINQLYHKKTTIYGGLNATIGSSVTAYLHGGYERQAAPSFDGIPTEADGTPAPLPRSFFIGSRNIVQTTSVYHAEGDVTWHANNLLDFSVKGNYESAHTGGAQTYAASSIGSNGDLAIAADKNLGNSVTDSYGVGASAIFRFDALGLKNSFTSLAALYQHSNQTGAVGFPEGNATANVFAGEAAISQLFDSLLTGPLFPYGQAIKPSTLTISAQSVLQIVEPLSVLVGVSYSKPDVTVIINGGPPQDFSFEHQISYRAGLTYQFLTGANVYASYSQSFTPQPLLTFNQSVVPPAIGTEYEAGFKYRPEGGRLLLTAALFQIKENNVAQYLETTPEGFNVYTSIGQLTHRGAELQALGHITPQWQLNASFAYLNPKNTDDVDPSHVNKTEPFQPKQTFSAYTDYTVRSGILRGITFGVGARYVGSQITAYDRSTKDFPGYTIVDAALSYSVEKWLLQLNVRNVLDRRYIINNYQTLIYGNQPGNPTNFSVMVKRTFF